MRFLFAVLTILLARSAVAQPSLSCDADLATLRTLYDVRRLLVGDPKPSPYEIDRAIETHIDRMREPLPSGGHRWVRLVRPPGDAPVIKKEMLLAATGNDLDEFTSEAADVFAVRVAVPRKRSIRRANRQAWIERVTVRYEADGAEKTIERPFRQWLQPDNWKTIDLPVIAERVEVTVEARAKPDGARATLVETHFRQAVPQDDPLSPYAATVALLKRLKGNITPANIDAEIARTERRLFPEVAPLPIASIARRIREADILLRSDKEEERKRGSALLQEAVRMLPD